MSTKHAGRRAIRKALHKIVNLRPACPHKLSKVRLYVDDDLFMRDMKPTKFVAELSKALGLE